LIYFDAGTGPLGRGEILRSYAGRANINRRPYDNPSEKEWPQLE